MEYTMNDVVVTILVTLAVVLAYGTIRILVDMYRYHVAAKWVMRMSSTLTFSETTALLRALKCNSPHVWHVLMPWKKLPGKIYVDAIKVITLKRYRNAGIDV